MNSWCLAQKEVPNILGVAALFSSGSHQVTVPGLVVKTPNWQSQFTAAKHDVLSLNIGGGYPVEREKDRAGRYCSRAVLDQPVHKPGRLRDQSGRGARLGPVFPERPQITPDALVTVTVGPDGQNNSATDHRSYHRDHGSAQSRRGPGRSADGARLDTGGSASVRGFALKHYTFAVYSQLAPTHRFLIDRQLRAGRHDDPDRRADERELRLWVSSQAGEAASGP